MMKRTNLIMRMTMRAKMTIKRAPLSYSRTLYALFKTS